MTYIVIGERLATLHRRTRNHQHQAIIDAGFDMHSYTLVIQIDV